MLSTRTLQHAPMNMGLTTNSAFRSTCPLAQSKIRVHHSASFVQNAQPPAAGIMARNQTDIKLQQRRTITASTQPFPYASDAVPIPFFSNGGTVPVCQTFEQMLLPHNPIEKEDEGKLKELLGETVFNKIRNSKHKDGLCHADTTVKFIEAAEGKIDGMTETLMNLTEKNLSQQGNFLCQLPLMLFGGLLNACIPLHESIKGNAFLYSKQELIEDGVPDNCLAVIINGLFGVIDPNSKQANSALSYFNAGEPGGANHAIAVLHVDKEKKQLLCCDLDPHRKNKDGSDQDVFFKVDIDTFSKRTHPFFLSGVVGVPKKTLHAD